MAIQNANLTTTTSNIIVSSESIAAMTFYFSNYSTTSNVTFSLWAVPNGEQPGNLNVLYSNVVVLAGDTYVMDRERLFLENGDRLCGYANANNTISCTLTYTTV
jgi:hypothetical protein